MILESTGTLFIGDGIQKFKKNELVLIGKNLPHMWRNDDIYFDLSSNLKAEAISIHFKKDFLGLNFFQSPEMSDISNLLERSGYGIKFSNYDPKIIEKVKKLNTLNGFEKLMELMAILNILAKHNKYELLSSEGFLNSFNRSGNKNLDKIYSYIFKNFNKTIKLKDVAEVANM
ncbi:MAG: AraC family transcriptional regulator, partial [Bacteroidota bacterium]